MPERPDIVAYLEALTPRVVGRRIRDVRIVSPFVLRTIDPPTDALVGARVTGLRRIGKRIVVACDADLFLVMHLMIAGRLRWLEAHAKPPARITLATIAFDADPAEAGVPVAGSATPTPARRARDTRRGASGRTDHGQNTPSDAFRGTLAITEASPKKRAALHVLRGEAALATQNPGGLDVLSCSAAAFAAALRRQNHTLKRALTDPHILDGVGNAYSDEILHAARLSPLQLTQRLRDGEVARLFAAARGTLTHWIDELRRFFAGRFPGAGEITAFRPGFAVHGRFGKACPACGATVQRIRYAENETNYCPRCQTGGRVLADRSLSRLLKDDWPRTIE